MKQKLHLPSLALIMILMSACTPATSQNSAMPDKIVLEKPVGEYTLGTGDKISLIVFGHEDLSGEFSVDSTGHISFPLIKETKVSGLTTKHLEDLVTEMLSPKYLVDPKVSIEVIDYRDIFILGEVRTPGKYDYIPDMTVQKAVAVAGGYTYRAKEGTVELTRQSEQAIETHIIDDKQILSPGDTIVVKRRWF